MKKLIQRLPNRFWVSRVEQSRRDAVNRPVTGITKRNEVVESVVAAVGFVSKAGAVNMMDVGLMLRAAFTASEVVAFQCLKIVPVSVLADQATDVRASRGAVERGSTFALRERPANVARKLNTARRTRPGARVAGSVLLSASVARLRVLLEPHVAPSRLTRLTARLNAMADSELRAAIAAAPNFSHLQNIAIGAG